MPDEKKKITRRAKLTLAQRLEPIDASIKRHEAELDELRARRADIITNEEARAKAALQAVEDAQSTQLAVLPLAELNK